MIAGEGAHQPARELTTDCRLEPLPGMRLRLGEPGDARAVVEEAADGFSVVGRQAVHGTLSIVATASESDPWRE